MGWVIFGLAALQGALFLGGLGWFIVSIFRAEPVKQEELERAQMRSCSWPTDEADQFDSVSSVDSRI